MKVKKYSWSIRPLNVPEGENDSFKTKIRLPFLYLIWLKMLLLTILRALSNRRVDMHKLTGFFRNITWLVFLGALLWSYAYMADAITYRLDNDSNALGITNKNTFFFSALGAFIIVNAACAGFIYVLKKIKSSEDGQGIRNRSLKLDIISWTKGFAGVLNVFLTITLVFLGYMNLSDNFQVESLGYFVYIGPLLLVIWFFYLVKLLSKKRA